MVGHLRSNNPSVGKKKVYHMHCALKSLKLINHEYFEKYKMPKPNIPQKP